MPDAALQAYLARNYLDGAKAEALLARAGGDGEEVKKHKKKKKQRDGGEGESSGQGVRLMEDGADESWKRQRIDDEEDAVIVEDEGEKHRARRTKWTKLGGEASGSADAAKEADDVAEADMPQIANAEGRSLDATAQDAVERQLQEQQQHQSASSSSSTAPAKRAGLKTREEMRAERLERERKAAEEARSGKRRNDDQRTAEDEEARRKRERNERQSETVYRDASGRRINVAAEEEERAREQEAARKRERAKQDWNKGDVQLQAARDARRLEEEARTSTFARGAGDVAMNDELRNVARQNDPATHFLTRKTDERKPLRPVYKGAFPPNRFGIRPGYRWDGVERGNGFEAKLFQRRNDRSRQKAEAQSWRQEDM